MDSLCDSVDPRVDLAVLRSELAWERTLLAWVRAVLTLIGAGVVFDKGAQLLQEGRPASGTALVVSGHFIGLSLTGVSTVLLLVVCLQYWQACAGSDQRLPDSAISSGAVGFNSRSRSGLCCVCGAEYRQEMTDAAGVPIAVVLSPARRRVTCDGVSFARCNVAIRRCGLPI